MKTKEDSFIEHIIDANKDILDIGTYKSIDIIPLHGGSSNINYQVTINNNKKFFVKHGQKEIASPYYKDNVHREYTITKILSQFDLAPKPFFFDSQNNVLISEFVKGRIPKTSDLDFSKTLVLIGNSLNFIRAVPVDLLQKIYTGTRICPKKFFQKIVEPTTAILATELLQEGSPALFHFLEDISTIINDRLRYEPDNDCTIDWDEFQDNPKVSPYGLLHNDLALRNILVTGDNNRPICFIDWEFADFGDIAYDMAYLQSENMLLQQQIAVITKTGNISNEIQNRIFRYTKIFLPMLELANAYWTINHIGQMIQKYQRIKLRPPYSIMENLNFIRNKIKRLVRLTHMDDTINPQKELELFNELQYALKIFESQLTVEGL